MKIDKNYSLVPDSFNWILKFKKQKQKEDGTIFYSKNEWYFPKIQMALNKYIQESLKNTKEIRDILKAIEKLEETINNLKW